MKCAFFLSNTGVLLTILAATASCLFDYCTQIGVCVGDLSRQQPKHKSVKCKMFKTRHNVL